MGCPVFLFRFKDHLQAKQEYNNPTSHAKSWNANSQGTKLEEPVPHIDRLNWQARAEQCQSQEG
jgi:hypothetical protein